MSSNRRNFIRIIPIALAGIPLMGMAAEKNPLEALVVRKPDGTLPEIKPSKLAPLGDTATSPAAAANVPVSSSALVDIDPKSTQAVALGYVTDAKKADKVKYKTFKEGSNCANCSLYLGKVTDKSAGCAIFPGKKVANAGWCSAHALRLPDRGHPKAG